MLAIALVVRRRRRAPAGGAARRVRGGRARLGHPAPRRERRPCRRTSHALGSQAGEDFAGVVMLWTHHTARDVVARAAEHVHLAVGLVARHRRLRAGRRRRGAHRLARAARAAVDRRWCSGPYAIFHLLFQETVTTRYALPLLPVIAYAAMAAVEGLPARRAAGRRRSASRRSA